MWVRLNGNRPNPRFEADAQERRAVQASVRVLMARCPHCGTNALPLRGIVLASMRSGTVSCPKCSRKSVAAGDVRIRAIALAVAYVPIVMFFAPTALHDMPVIRLLPLIATILLVETAVAIAWPLHAASEREAEIRQGAWPVSGVWWGLGILAAVFLALWLVRP